MDYFKHETAIVEDGAQIGEGTRIWAFAHIKKGALIGKNCNICNGSFVEDGVILGSNVTVKHHVSFFNGVTIEDDVFVGSNIAFINDRRPRSDNNDWKLEKTLVKKGATLGSNAVIMCGVTVGECAMVAAGAVVLKDVDPYTVVSGNPAKFCRYISKSGKKADKAGDET